MSEPSPNGPAPARVLNFRTLASELLMRARLWGRSGIGSTFDGRRNFYDAFGYKLELSMPDYRWRFKRGGIAKRIITALPEATWRAGGEVLEDQNPKVVTPFEKAWRDFNTKFELWPMFKKADVQQRIGRYSVIFIGAPGDFGTPLDHLAPGQLLYFKTFAEDDAPVQRFELDPLNPRFGQPVMYALRRNTVEAMMSPDVNPFLPNQGTTMTRSAGMPLHWTRVIHIAEDALDDSVYSPPALEAVWNYLDDLDKVVGGGAEASWHRANQGTQFDIDPSISLGRTPKEEEDNLKKFEEELEDYENGLRRTLRTRGVKIDTLSSSVSNFLGNQNALVDLISATTGIPQRILMGSERGSLASTQDKSNWDERVSDRRTDFAGPQVVRPFVDKMISLNVLPAPAKGPTAYTVSWPEIEELDEKGKLKAALDAAQINKTQGETVVTGDEIRMLYLNLEPLTDVQKKQLQDVANQKAEAAAALKAKFAPQAGLVDVNGQPISGTAQPPQLTNGTQPPQLAAAVAKARMLAAYHGKSVLDVKSLERAILRRDQRLLEKMLT